MRKVLEITFAGESFETRIAATTNDAFSLLAERQISVALVDVTLGEQSGYDVCKRIKSEYPAVKVLLLSSKQSPYDAARGVSSGADDHLDKPFDTQVLIDKVRGLLTRIAAQTTAAQTPAAQTTAAQTTTAQAPAAQTAMQPAAPVTLAPTPDKPTTAAAFPGHTSDSKIPTAMPEAPTEELLDDDDGPLLIPIDDDDELSEPSPATIAPVAASQKPAPQPASEPAPEPAAARTVIMHNKAADHTLPANGSAAFAPLESKLSALGLTDEQVSAVLALSREVVEAAVWEVVPTLAETLIKEEIRRLTQ